MWTLPRCSSDSQCPGVILTLYTLKKSLFSTQLKRASLPQPDIAASGGLSEFLKIAALASTFGVRNMLSKILDHILKHALDHVLEHALKHVIENVLDHVVENVLKHVTHLG